jgi:hypothetical protein
LAVNEFHLNVYLAPRTAAINAFEIIIIYWVIFDSEAISAPIVFRALCCLLLYVVRCEDGCLHVDRYVSYGRGQ